MLGKRIKLLREAHDPPLTREELAVILNINYQTMSKYETEDRSPDYETLKSIAKFFNVSIDYLLGNTDISEPSTKEDFEEISEIINFVRENSKKMSPAERKQLSRAIKAFVKATEDNE